MNTPYYIRAYATNIIGTAYGNQVVFATADTSGSFICGTTPLVDSRDYKIYNSVQIGTRCWMAQNLNIGTRLDGSIDQANNSIIEKYCYNDDELNCNVYGGLYQWNEMMQYITTEGTKGICPTGWHLPADEEWTSLTTSLGGVDMAGGKMKSTGTIQGGTGLWNEPNFGATNSSGFTAVPAGELAVIYSPPPETDRLWNFMDISDWNRLWSSSGTMWHLNSEGENIVNYIDASNSGLSVRCIKNDP
jgi:uncharacterized protein (TIGR02145 family)